MSKSPQRTRDKRIPRARASAGEPSHISLDQRTLDTRPDTLDFRDVMFVPTLVEVPTRRPLEEYRKFKVPILDQGKEGACTGFGLATVIHYLLRSRRVVADREQVSPWMLYHMARRYDEWPGERYSGSSARGAMKGWHKHGVCSHRHWLNGSDDQDSALFVTRYADALRRPLGAYLRVNHRDIVAMHAAISEAGIIYASAQVHDGWGEKSLGPKGLIAWSEDRQIEGGHAFAIVGYDEKGFWFQNSWGEQWGIDGFGQITYDDWLANGTDAWVARLGAPIILRERESVTRGVGAAAHGTRGYVFCDLRPHVISLGREGKLTAGGTYGTSVNDVREIFAHIRSQLESRRLTRLLIYAHGGLTAEDSAIQKVAELRAPLLDAGIYPVVIIWRTEFWTTVRNLLQDAVSRRRPEGLLDSAKDFMLDRLDDALEPVARAIGGKSGWEEMKDDAIMASRPDGGLRIVMEEVQSLMAGVPSLELHMVGHSAGSILLGGFLKALTETTNLAVRSCTLWAPACTMQFYRDHYLPALQRQRLRRLAVFAMTDRAEQDDQCANIYHKSLLYLVSHAFERYLRQPGLLKGARSSPNSQGEPLLGMAKWIESDLKPDEKTFDLVLSPNAVEEGSRDASRATSHGGFEDDGPTLRATLARILDHEQTDATFGDGRVRSIASNRARREGLTARPEV